MVQTGLREMGVLTHEQIVGQYEQLTRRRAESSLAGVITTLEALIAVTGLPFSREHYSGPETFDYVVYAGTTFENIRDNDVPPENRWDRLQLPASLRGALEVLSATEPRCRQLLDEITDLAERISGLPEDDTERASLRREYTLKVAEIQGNVAEKYRELNVPNPVPVTLLNGALIFEKVYGFEDSVRVNAKRLDMGHEIAFGFKDMDGEALARVNEQYKDKKVTLVFADDCGATLGSIISAVRLMRELHEKGLFPEIEGVQILLTVVTQQGVEKAQEEFGKMGLKFNIIAGDLTHGLDEHFYLRRVRGEKRQNGMPFDAGQPVVRDMGQLIDSDVLLQHTSN